MRMYPAACATHNAIMTFSRCYIALACLACSILSAKISAFVVVSLPQHLKAPTSVCRDHRARRVWCPSGRADVLHSSHAGWGRSSCLSMSDNDDEMEESFGEKAMKERTRAELQELVSEHKIIAFIKGNRLMPQCGFSGTMVNILQSLSVPFETVDVLSDDRIRQGIKDFSDWPTIPQLYLGGEFVGGADIVIELFQSGELQEMIEVAAAS